jgi:diguanylate cyclase (GGDEF)-like protein
MVLVIEQNEPPAAQLSDLLRLYGFFPVWQRSADEAVDYARQHSVETVVIAYDIPGGPFPLAQRLVAVSGYEDVPLVIAAGDDADEATRIEALYYGIFGWLRKPCDDFEVLLTISNMVRVHGLRRELHKKVEELDVLASTDMLTGLYNRRFLMRRLDEECARARRAGTPISLIYVDIDHFKQINDAHGHQIGDEVLQYVAKIMAGVMRRSDVLGRVGGEEFIAVLPGSGAVDGHAVAERLRQRVEAKQLIRGELEIPVTISAGVTTSESIEGLSVDELIHTADQALYLAKQNGRNRVVIAQPVHAAQPV